jgi:hypothetical protein
MGMNRLGGASPLWTGWRGSGSEGKENLHAPGYEGTGAGGLH